MSTSAIPGNEIVTPPDTGSVPLAPSDADGRANENSWQPFPFPEQTNRTWREQALTRAAELRTLLETFSVRPDGRSKTQASHLDGAIKTYLQNAVTAAKELSRWRPLRNPAVKERIASNLDAAEVELLRRAPESYLCGQIDHVLAHVRLHLPKSDPRRMRVEKLVDQAARGILGKYDKEAVVQAVWAASLEARREVVRVQNFCIVLYATAMSLAIVAIGLAAWGLTEPSHVPVCFRPEDDVQVCPTGADYKPIDILLIEFVGLLAGAVSGAAGLRHMNGRTTRLGLPVALAVMKLPTGALTAVLGLLLMRGNFLPGLSNLDTSAQIIAWAIVFGAAQQLVTGLVDRRAQDVLSQVAGMTDRERR